MRLESLIVGPIDTPTGQRVDFQGLPLTKTRKIWQDWLRRHSIDPDAVAVTPGWVERRPAQRQVAYVAYKRREHGATYVDPDTGIAARETIVVQLESEPAPFPEVGAMTIWATDRCSGCEWVEISTLAEMATGDRQYVQGRWCERHVPTSVLYGSARRRYIETGDEAALAEMLQHVEEAR